MQSVVLSYKITFIVYRPAARLSRPRATAASRGAGALGTRAWEPKHMPRPESVLRHVAHSIFQSLDRNLPKNPGRGPALWAPSAPKMTHSCSTVCGVPDPPAQRGWHRPTPTTHASPHDVQAPDSPTNRRAAGICVPRIFGPRTAPSAGVPRARLGLSRHTGGPGPRPRGHRSSDRGRNSCRFHPPEVTWGDFKAVPQR